MPTSVAKFKVHPSPGGKWFWGLYIRGKLVAESADSFTTKAHARRNAESVSRHAGTATIVDE